MNLTARLWLIDSAALRPRAWSSTKPPVCPLIVGGVVSALLWANSATTTPS